MISEVGSLKSGKRGSEYKGYRCFKLLPNLSQLFGKTVTHKQIVKHCKLKLLLKCFIALIWFYVFGD